MTTKSLIKAALLTAALTGLTAPVLAQRSERGQSSDDSSRGGGRDGGRNDNGARGNGGGRGEGRGDEGRGRPAQSAPAPVVQAVPPVAVQRQAPIANNPRASRSDLTPRGVGQGGGAVAQNNAPREQGRPSGNWQGGGRDDRGGRDNAGRDNAGRDNVGRGNDGRGNDGRDWSRGNDVRSNVGRNNDGRNNDGRDWNRGNNNGNDRNWSFRDNNGREWRYNQGRRVENRWDGFRRWDNNSWRRDQRYNWQNWRNSHGSIFRLPSYNAPYGWNRGYSRFSIGIYLNSILFGSSYWIDDPYSYRLPPTYGPMRWVRYYDDALLVDIRDGYVVDVIHDFFW